MKHIGWALTQFHPHGERPDVHPMWPVAASYSNGHVAPRHPETADGWALVRCSHLHFEAAKQDPRVEPYRTVWDVITPKTVETYAAQGAKPGMMLCQLLSLLANNYEMGFADNDM